MQKVSKRTLGLTALLLAAALALMQLCAAHVPAEDAEIMLRAEEIMRACSERIRLEKENTGLGLAPEDRFLTGLIGAPFSEITTTLGPVEAKRTAADSSMAALLARMLGEAGIGAGDKVAAGFSGSFPGLNLAVLAACEAMGAEIVYICSAGASTYGANQPELTFPDMACLLHREGLIQTAAAAYSYGGDRDVGADMDAQSCENLRMRMEKNGVPLIYEADFAQNLALRRAVYEADGMPDCFIGVGGGIMTQGRGESSVEWGVTPAGTIHETNEKSGLLEIYNSEGLPVISLLNIKKLAADYGLPYDPETACVPGASPLYTQEETIWPIAPVALVGAALLLRLDPFGRKKRKKGGSEA